MNTHVCSSLLPRLLNATLWLVLIAFVSPAPLCGQAVMSTLPISVTDTNGAAIPNATVKVINIETGFERTQATNADGLTTFVGLPPGSYKIQVEAQGFKMKVWDKIDVGVSRAGVLSLQMDIGAPTETVSVSSTTEVNEDPLESLTNINNGLAQIQLAIPGAAAGAPSLLGRIVPDTKGKEQQTLRLDGLDVSPLTDLPTGDPSHGIIDSFLKTNVALNGVRTVTHSGTITFEAAGGDDRNYSLSPMYGPGTGTLLEGLSYRGIDGKKADLFKFQVYEGVRNDALNKRNFFEHEGKNPIRRNQFGVRAGTPILAKKVALFFGYDGIRARSERNVYEAVPADAQCLCGGGPVSPLLGGFLPNGTTVLDKDASKNNDFLIAKRRVLTSSDGNAWDGRLDFSGLQRENFTVRFTRQDAKFLVPDGVTGRSQRQGVVLANGIAKLSLFRPSASHELKFGINQTKSYSLVDLLPSTDQRLAQSLIAVGSSIDVTGLPGNPETVPVATLGGLIRNAGRGFDQTAISFNPAYDLITAIGDRHQLEAGFEARIIRLDFDRFGGLTYTFPDIAALRSGTPTAVNFLSDLSGASPFSNAGERRATQEYYLSYFQLISNLTPRFVLYTGLRYDYFSVPREQNSRAVVVDPQTGKILPPDTPFYKASKLNFQPRVAVAYQLANRTVLRGGVGFFSGTPRIGDLLLPIESDRFNTGRLGGTFPLTAAEISRDFVENPDTRQFQPLSFARDFTTPERIFRWDAMLTHTFWRATDLNLIYSGNIGRNLPVAGISNQIVSVQTDPDPTRSALVRRQFDFDRSGLLFKPFGELQFRASEGRSSFNGLTVQFKRNNDTSIGTSEHWLDWQNFTSFNAQYTLGRNVGNVSGAVAADPFDFNSDFGFNASDVRHTFSLSAGYRLWDDKNGRSRRDIIWGWTIGPTITARTGVPLVIRLDRPDVVYVDGAGNIFGSPAAGRTAVLNTPGGGASGGTRVPDLVPGVNPYLRNDLQHLNPAAFAIPAPGTFGNLKRGQLRGPGSYQVDLTFTRVLFYNSELANKYVAGADLKIEITNLFNRTNFSNPPVTLPNALGTSDTGNRIQPGVPFTRLAAGPTFGIFNAAESPRLIQFTLTFKFNEGF